MFNPNSDFYNPQLPPVNLMRLHGAAANCLQAVFNVNIELFFSKLNEKQLNSFQ